MAAFDRTRIEARLVVAGLSTVLSLLILVLLLVLRGFGGPASQHTSLGLRAEAAVILCVASLAAALLLRLMGRALLGEKMYGGAACLAISLGTTVGLVATLPLVGLALSWGLVTPGNASGLLKLGAVFTGGAIGGFVGTIVVGRRRE